MLIGFGEAKLICRFDRPRVFGMSDHPARAMRECIQGVRTSLAARDKRCAFFATARTGHVGAKAMRSTRQVTIFLLTTPYPLLEKEGGRCRVFIHVTSERLCKR